METGREEKYESSMGVGEAECGRSEMNLLNLLAQRIGPLESSGGRRFELVQKERKMHLG